VVVSAGLRSEVLWYDLQVRFKVVAEPPSILRADTPQALHKTLILENIAQMLAVKHRGDESSSLGYVACVAVSTLCCLGYHGMTCGILELALAWC
jgi:hypothetical protein